MTAKGHTTLAITVGLAAQQLLVPQMNAEPVWLLAYYVALVNGALLPDLDEPGSRIGRRWPFLSHFLALFTTHRGVTHYLIVPLAIAVPLFFIDNDPLFYLVLGLAVGVLAHDMGDMLTKGGIVGFFYPFMQNRRVGIPRRYAFYTNSIEEYGVIAGLLLINTATIISLFGNKLQQMIGA